MNKATQLGGCNSITAIRKQTTTMETLDPRIIVPVREVLFRVDPALAHKIHFIPVDLLPLEGRQILVLALVLQVLVVDCLLIARPECRPCTGTPSVFPLSCFSVFSVWMRMLLNLYLL